MPAITQRDALASLTKRRLSQLAHSFELQISSSASKDEHIDALAHSRRASYEKILASLPRDELKTICRDAGIDDSGKAKAEIVARILGVNVSGAASSRSEDNLASSESSRSRKTPSGDEGAKKKAMTKHTTTAESNSPEPTKQERAKKKRGTKNGNRSAAVVGSTQIPVCLWFLSRDKKNGLGGRGKKMRNRKGETLFIDARKLGAMIDRVHRELTDADIERIAETYHRWRGDGAGKYEDVAGFCKSATTAEIEAHQFVLTPGRYVGAEAVEDDGEPFEEKMVRLVGTLEEQFKEGARLKKAIRESIAGLGYGE